VVSYNLDLAAEPPHVKLCRVLPQGDIYLSIYDIAQGSEGHYEMDINWISTVA